MAGFARPDAFVYRLSPPNGWHDTTTNAPRLHPATDNWYAPEHDSGIAWNDPALNIDWQIPEESILLSGKDKMLKFFTETEIPF